MRKSYYYGAMAFGLLFTACSDTIMNEPTIDNGPLEKDQTFYVNMAIRGDIPGTRSGQSNGNPDHETAGDFDPGSEDANENGINNAYFVFYDEDGNVVGDIVPIENIGEENEEIVNETVEKWYSSTIPVVVRKGEKTPSSVICYINPISPSTLQNPLNVIQTIARSNVYTTVNGKKYFAMSNSVYYPTKGVDPSADAALEPQIAVEIPYKGEGKNRVTGLFKTEEEAKKALEAGNENNDLIVNIYVERYASKLTFSTPTADPYVTATRVYNDEGTSFTTASVSLQFTADRWALNAESKRSYVIKSFRMESELGQIMANNYTYGVLNSRINATNTSSYNNLATGTVIDNILTQETGRWAWNNPAYNRSYWAISPAYFEDNYPVVAGDLDLDDPNLQQNYLTYGSLTTGTNKAGFEVPAAGTSSTQYFKETTVGTKALTSDNPAAAMPSVILVGSYKVTSGATTDRQVGFYTYLNGDVTVNGETESRPYIYFNTAPNSLDSEIAGTGSMLKRFIAQSTILYKKDTDGTWSRFTIADARVRLANPEQQVGLTVSEISDAVKKAVDGDETTMLKLQANARSLQITSAAAAEGIYIATANGYMAIVADDIAEEDYDNDTMIKLTEANSILMQQVGYAYYYDNGHGYFNIPVKHLGWYRAGNDQKETEKETGKIDWSLVRVGDFGMVRNHSYNVQVNKITGLASGIAGDDTPIVPPASTDEYYIAYSVRILKWAVVPTQGANL